MVDQRIDGGPCPRLVPLQRRRFSACLAVPPPWKDYLLEVVYGPDYCWEISQDDDYRPDIVERPGDYVWNDLFDRDDE